LKAYLYLQLYAPSFMPVQMKISLPVIPRHSLFHHLLYGTSCYLCGLLWVDLLAILVVPNTWWGSAVAAAFSGTDTNDFAVDGAGNAVLELQVHLWNGVFGEDRGIGDIADGGRFNHVPDGEPLDCLVLWCASRAVGATDRLYMATTLFVSTI